MDLKSLLEKNVAGNLARDRGGAAAAPAQAPTPALGERAGRRRDPSLFALAIDRIRADEMQVRRENKLETDPEVIELSQSIRDVGVLEPINVRYVADGDY